MDQARLAEHLPKLLFNEMQQGTEAFRNGALGVLGARNAQDVKCAVREILIRHEREKVESVEAKKEVQQKQSKERRSSLRKQRESVKYRESIAALLSDD